MTAEATTNPLDELRELLAPITKRLNEGVQGAEVAAASAAAATTQSVGIEASGGQPTSRLISVSDQLEMRDALRKRSSNDLLRIFSEQANRENTGIPLSVWLSQGGQARIAGFEQGMQGGSFSPDVVRLLDTSQSGPLIRQDLEPVLWELFVRDFPAVDRFSREPANGLVHTFQQMTGFGDAQFMPELGTVTDDRGTYVRQTTNIAILATRRGVSLKNQFATVQSGSGFSPQDLELRAGLRAMSNRLQNQIFSGHATDSGGTADNELGLYDANAFTGLRAILNTGRAKNVTMDLDATPEPLRIAVDQACVEIMQAGPGRPSIGYLHPEQKSWFDEAQDKNVRYLRQDTEVAPGMRTNGINTVFGEIPLFPVPGNAIDDYVSTEYSSNTVRDLYLLDEASITLPYLGSEGLTVLEIPVGVSGQLTRLFIIFLMVGLAVRAPSYSNKVRIKTSLA